MKASSIKAELGNLVRLKTDSEDKQRVLYVVGDNMGLVEWDNLSGIRWVPLDDLIVIDNTRDYTEELFDELAEEGE